VDKGWNKMVSMMLSEYDGCKDNYGMDGGDCIEAITVDDKRFEPTKFTEPRPLAQAKIATKKREPIKHLLLCIMQGNHEDKLWPVGDIIPDMCEELGVPFGTSTVKLTINNLKGELMYKIFDTHGSKGISSNADDPHRKKSNMELILKRQLRNKQGDCAVMIKHHTHKLLVCKPEFELYLYSDDKKVRQGYTQYVQNAQYIHPDARWYGNAGSFMKLYGDGFSGYAEKFEYDPTEIGFLILKVRDKKIVDLVPYYLDI